MLYWRGLRLAGVRIPDGEASAGHHVRMVMPAALQNAFLERVFRPCPAIGPGRDGAESHGRVWVEAAGVSHLAGSEGFFHAVGALIRGRGMLANLSLRENLLLPFLYDTDHERLDRAIVRLDEVAEMLGLRQALDERAAEGSDYMHAMVSLGRCLLARPGVVVAQESHAGMSPERLERFRSLAMRVLRELDAGVLYLTSSEDEGSGIAFARTLTIADGCGRLAGVEAAS